MLRDIIFIFFLLVFVNGEEKSSMTFVLDDTGSMRHAIDAVKDGANAIFDAVLKSNYTQIEDFVLVTFNDPITNPTTTLRTITNDSVVFKKALSAIVVGGGDDCQEYPISGIIEGISHSRPGSTLYVFTDASAKDHKLYNDAKHLALKKQIQVIFVLTGICERRDGPDYQVFKNLSRDTRGQIYHMDKTEIKEIVKDVVENAKGRRTILAEAEFPPGKHSMIVPVDGMTKDTIVSVTGNDTTVKVSRPDGKIADIDKILDRRETRIVKIKDPATGNYTVGVDSPVDTRVLVTARTKVKFQHGFSTFKPTSIKDTTTMPLPDVQSYITIQLTDGDIDLKTVKIVKLDGTFEKEVPLTLLDVKDRLYITKRENLPDEKFKLVISGIDPSTGETITRDGPPIEPQPKTAGTNKKPTVSILGAPLMKDPETPVELSCKVSGYPEPKVVWQNLHTGKVIPANVSVVEYPDKFISILKLEVDGTEKYKCEASNSMGIEFDEITVQSKEFYLKIVRPPLDTTIKYKESGQLNCQVDAYPPATISWYKDKRFLAMKDNIQLSDDKMTLTIKDMGLDDAGSYICEARNSKFRDVKTAELFITGIADPVIERGTYEIKTLLGSDAAITCNLLQGYPTPRITWFYTAASREEEELPSFENKTTLTLTDVKESDSGLYTCFAKNIVDYDEHAVELIVQYPPKISNSFYHREKLNSTEYSTVYIPCFVTGSPDPTVTWYKDNIELKSSADIFFFRSHEIRIKNTKVSDSGIYTCKATNELGTASKVVKLDVYDPVKISIRQRTKIKTNEGSPLGMSCPATGHPTPKIEWTHLSFDPKVPPKQLRTLTPQLLTFKSIKPEDEGFYTCKAFNDYTQQNLTYELQVVAPPEIEDTYLDQDRFEGVDGDLVLMIQCKASGRPKPAISWFKNGYHIRAGLTTDDGTLILQHVTSHATGRYVCEARNTEGVAKEIFHVQINPSPKPGPPSSVLRIKKDDSADIPCNIPHTKIDLLRWYKDDVLVHTGELTIRNANKLHSGTYTCRVSNFTTSVSDTTKVIVGFAPKFEFDEDTDIEYDEGSQYAMSCDAISLPKPTYAWWHNGQVLNATESYITITMEPGTQGRYSCEAMNEFGSVRRDYNIEPRDCMIDIKQHSKLQPLTLGKEYDWLEYPVKNGYMKIPKDDYIGLYCPNAFKTHPNRNLEAFCDGGNDFKIRGRKYELKDLECTEEIEFKTVVNGAPCFSGNAQFFEIGFDVDEFSIPSYYVCFDMDRNETIYTYMTVTTSSADIDYPESWLSDGDGLDLAEAYDCTSQSMDISRSLGRRFHLDDGCCFGKLQLVNSKDLPPGVSQKAAYSPMNVVPHWGTCNVNTNNWLEVEHRVRSLAKESSTPLTVTTGVAKNLAIPDYARKPESIALKDGRGHKQTVPLYLWKLVQEPNSRSSLVIVQVNQPDLTNSEARRLVLCRDICNDTEWMKGSNWNNETRGLVFCCSLREFEIAFGFEKIFDKFYNVLYEISLVSGHSLTI